MKKNNSTAIVLLVTLPIVTIAFVGWRTWRYSAIAAKNSAILALIQEIDDVADAHCDAVGLFPETLDEMTITNFSDGGSPEMLDEIKKLLTVIQ